MMKNKNKRYLQRLMATAVSLSMCIGMACTTAFAAEPNGDPDAGTDAGTGSVTVIVSDPVTETTQTGDEANGGSTTTTTSVETTVTVKTEETKENSEAMEQGEETIVGQETETVDEKTQEEITEEDLSFEASATIDLKGGSGSGTADKTVTAEDIAKDLGWTCTDSEHTYDEDGKEINTSTKVTDEGGKYVVESVKETTETVEGEKTETGATASDPVTVLDETKTEQGIPSGPDLSVTEEVSLPERPAAGTTENDDGTSTVVIVEDVKDDDGNTIGYTVITEERDADGNVTSTRTENVAGNKKVETSESTAVDTETKTTTTKTETTVTEVKEDMVYTQKETVTNSVSVCDDRDTLAATINIDLKQDTKAEELGQKVVLSKDDVVSADVSIKQEHSSTDTVTADVTFNLEIKQGARPEDLQVTVVQYTGSLDQYGYPEYIKLGTATVKGGNDGKTGTISFAGLNLATGETSKITFDISYAGYADGAEYAGLVIDMEVKDIKTISASAKHTETSEAKDERVTTEYERVDTLFQTETSTKVTTTTSVKATATETVASDWKTEIPEAPVVPDTPDIPETPVVPEIPDTPVTPVPPVTDDGDDDDGSDPGYVPDDEYISDDDVPLAGTPEDATEDVPEAEIPEGTIPEETIPDEDVPLADIPEEDVTEEEIPDEDVPLSDIPEEDIPEGDVPLGDIPQTGDESRAGFFAAMMVFSAMGLAGLAFAGRKRENI